MINENEEDVDINGFSRDTEPIIEADRLARETPRIETAEPENEISLDNVSIKINFDEDVEMGDYLWADVTYKCRNERGFVESVQISVALHDFGSMKIEELRRAALARATELLKSASVVVAG